MSTSTATEPATIAETLAALGVLATRQSALEVLLARQRSQLEIECKACSKRHVIAQLVAIQTHWYTSPSGCSEGDYWNVGEMHFICPETGIRNRLLFDNNDVPWRLRSQYDLDPEAQFRRIYGPLFASVQDEHEHSTPGRCVNNDTVNEQRSAYGLVERGAAVDDDC